MNPLNLTPLELNQIERERADYHGLISKICSQKKPSEQSGIDLTCIGNAGGADSLVHGQPTGGLLFRGCGRTMVIDPGDNSLSFLVESGFDPYDVTDVLASHAHNDHVGDLSALISAAINLGLAETTDRHILASPSLVDYSNPTATSTGFMLPAYAWQGQVHALFWKPENMRRFDGTAISSEPAVTISDSVCVSATKAVHSDIQVTGFLIDTPLGRIGYTSDTEYFPELNTWYPDVQVLWMNINTLALNSVDDADLMPQHDLQEPIANHLGYLGVCSLIEEVRPRTAIISHFGAQLLAHRVTIEKMLRERFTALEITIHCPDNGDSLIFDDLYNPPTRQEFVP